MRRGTLAILMSAALVAGLFVTGSKASPSDPFRGAWRSVDAVDGSNQHMSFGGAGATRVVRLFDDAATACDGVPATAQGPGTISGSSIEVEFVVDCAGTQPDPEGNPFTITFTHDPVDDTLSEANGTIWNRP